MKKRWFFLLLFVPTVSLLAQTPYRSYEMISDEEEVYGSLMFPVFTSSSPATEKINQTLQLSELEMLKGYEHTSIFETVAGNNKISIYGNVVTMLCAIYANNNRHLSVKFDKSSCGMTCAYWVQYYNFNPGNGDLFQLKDLFTKEGFGIFSAYAKEKMKKDLEISICEQMGQKNSEGFDEVVENYENNTLEDFFIRNDTLFLDGENAFSKNQKFYGINTITLFTQDEFKDHLNAYGKAVFGLSRKEPGKFRSESLPQLFKGEIGGEKILMVLKNTYEEYMAGEYVYLKYGKGIYLKGTLKDNVLLMTEKDNDFEDNGYLEAKMKNNRITGKWRSKDRKKEYPLFLERK